MGDVMKLFNNSNKNKSGQDEVNLESTLITVSPFEKSQARANIVSIDCKIGS